MKKIIRISIAIVWLLIMALPALANSSNYAWDMPWDGYYVNGKDNGILHSLTAGTLTDSVNPRECPFHYAWLDGLQKPHPFIITKLFGGIFFANLFANLY